MRAQHLARLEVSQPAEQSPDPGTMFLYLDIDRRSVFSQGWVSNPERNLKFSLSDLYTPEAYQWLKLGF